MAHLNLTRSEARIEAAQLGAAMFGNGESIGFHAALREADRDLATYLAFADAWDAEVAREVQLLDDLAADWDAWAGQAALDAVDEAEDESDPWDDSEPLDQPAPAPTVDPKIEAAWQRAQAKAEFEWIGGARPRFRNGRAFVGSRTTAGVVYTITGEGQCSCEAGRHNRPCFHVALVALAAGEDAVAA
jgi:hypothetical protein